MTTTNTTRGASFKPGELGKRTSNAKPKGKPFDVKEWHKRKAAEAQAKRKQARQIETCYKQYVPPQVQYGPAELTKREEGIAALMRNNRAVGL